MNLALIFGAAGFLTFVFKSLFPEFDGTDLFEKIGICSICINFILFFFVGVEFCKSCLFIIIMLLLLFYFFNSIAKKRFYDNEGKIKSEYKDKKNIKLVLNLFDWFFILSIFSTFVYFIFIIPHIYMNQFAKIIVFVILLPVFMFLLSHLSD